MLLLKFEPDEIKNCKTLIDVFEMFGIGITKDSKQDLSMRNKEVFGEKAYYKNLILSPKTADLISDQLRSVGKDNEAGLWANYAPVSNGPRFEIVKERIGEINDSVLYIVTPEDDLYEEDPSTKVSQDEQSVSNS